MPVISPFRHSILPVKAVQFGDGQKIPLSQTVQNFSSDPSPERLLILLGALNTELAKNPPEPIRILKPNPGDIILECHPIHPEGPARCVHSFNSADNKGTFPIQIGDTDCILEAKTTPFGFQFQLNWLEPGVEIGFIQQKRGRLLFREAYYGRRRSTHLTPTSDLTIVKPMLAVFKHFLPKAKDRK